MEEQSWFTVFRLDHDHQREKEEANLGWAQRLEALMEPEDLSWPDEPQVQEPPKPKRGRKPKKIKDKDGVTCENCGQKI